jgi:hypothetical protein
MLTYVSSDKNILHNGCTANAATHTLRHCPQPLDLSLAETWLYQADEAHPGMTCKETRALTFPDFKNAEDSYETARLHALSMHDKKGAYLSDDSYLSCTKISRIQIGNFRSVQPNCFRNQRSNL